MSTDTSSKRVEANRKNAAQEYGPAVRDWEVTGRGSTR